MTVRLEVERKFLVVDPVVVEGSAGLRIEQAYLFADRCTVIRLGRRRDGWRLAVRQAGPSVVRREATTLLPEALGRALFDSAAARTSIKWRHQIQHRGRIWSIDVYEAPHRGLLVAEVELVDHLEPVEIPPWCGREVTGDAAFYDEALAINRNRGRDMSFDDATIQRRVAQLFHPCNAIEAA
jgi:CYTH domain-containing protein